MANQSFFMTSSAVKKMQELDGAEIRLFLHILDSVQKASFGEAALCYRTHAELAAEQVRPVTTPAVYKRLKNLRDLDLIYQAGHGRIYINPNDAYFINSEVHLERATQHWGEVKRKHKSWNQRMRMNRPGFEAEFSSTEHRSLSSMAEAENRDFNPISGESQEESF